MAINTSQSSDTETSRRVVEQAYERGNVGDLEGFAALLADHIVVEEAEGHPYPGTTFKGKEEVVPAFFTRYRWAKWPFLRGSFALAERARVTAFEGGSPCRRSPITPPAGANSCSSLRQARCSALAALSPAKV